MRVTGVPAVAAGLCLTGAWLVSAGAAHAQDPVVFPGSLERAPLLAWLQSETDIQADRVVAVTPQALVSVVSTFPAGPGTGPRVVLRAEALSAEVVERTGALSWHVSMNADCQSHRVRLGETTGYPERNLLGERKTLRVAETDWRTPDSGAALEAAWRAACDADFKGPFQDATVTVAQPDAGATAPTPAPEAPPPSAAAPQPATRAAKPAPAGGLVVQVGASPSEAEAQGLLTALGSSLDGRQSWIETAQVGGKTWRRAIVGGFADGAEAARFCAGLKAAGRGCFVRAARPG